MKSQITSSPHHTSWQRRTAALLSAPLALAGFAALFRECQHDSLEPSRPTPCTPTDTVTAAPQKFETKKLAGINQKDPVDIAYLEAGDPSKPMILFVHGFPMSKETFIPALQRYAQSCHVVAIDTRGIGESSASTTNNYNFDTLVDDLADVIARLNNGQKVTVVGQDWGGMIASGLAAQHPELVEKLVGLDTPFPDLLENELKFEVETPPAEGAPSLQKSLAYVPRFVGLIDAFDSTVAQKLQENPGASKEQISAAVQPTFIKLLVSGQDGKSGLTAAILPQMPEEQREQVLQLWSSGGVLNGLRYYKAIVNSAGANGFTVDFGEDLPTVRVPSFFVQGGNDPINPQVFFDEGQVSVEVPGLDQVDWLDGVGRYGTQSHAELVFRELDEALSKDA